eukprot:jgi/Ulvmu1/5902/UM026_0023.1
MERNEDKVREKEAMRTVESDIRAAMLQFPGKRRELRQLLKDARAGLDDDVAGTPHRKRRRILPHPSNELLASAPDFTTLASKYPAVRPFVREQDGRSCFHWHDWNANHALAQALFEEHFGVRNWKIPLGRLIPAIPNRLNYLLWVNDLLQLSRQGDGAISGLDIGCGCNLVYPLLGASRFGWRFTAADNDKTAIESANNILKNNPNLNELISLRWTRCNEDQVQACRGDMAIASRDLPGALTRSAGSQSFDFCMCNPPFFSQDDHACQGTAVYGGVSTEMVCGGGELEFVRSMISDSLSMHKTGTSSCHWYTTMLGKKASFKSARKMVNAIQLVTAVRTSELVQGRQTRWVLAWSFTVPSSVSNLPLRPR